MAHTTKNKLLAKSTEKKQLDTKKSWTENTEAALFSKLAECEHVLKSFGKKIELNEVTSVFVRILSEYEPEAVLNAVEKHLSDGSGFPEPSDIKKILNGHKELSHDLYRKILDKRKKGSYLSYAEDEYMGRYEKYYL